MPSPQTVSVRVSGEALAALDSRVAADNSSRSEVIRSLITGAGHPTGYVWAAYYEDSSAFVPFGSEMDALRYAVEKSMAVIRIPFGVSLSQAIDAEHEATRRL